MSKSLIVTLQEPAVSILVSHSLVNGEPINITTTVDGIEFDSQKLITQATGYDNIDTGDCVTNGVRIEVTKADAGKIARIDVDETEGSATLFDAKAFPESSNLWAGYHCEPLAVEWSGKLLTVSIDSATSLPYLMCGGRNMGQIMPDIPAAQIQAADKYHQGYALNLVGGGIEIWIVYHNSRLYRTWIPSPEALSKQHPAQDVTGVSMTYVRTVTVGEISYAVSRASSNYLSFIKVENPALATPTITESVLLNGRIYPRALRVLGEKICIGYQSRTGETWEHAGAVFFDTVSDSFVNYRNESLSGTGADTTNPVISRVLGLGPGFPGDSGATYFLPQNGSGQRYTLSEFAYQQDTAGTKVAFVFVDTSDNPADSQVSNSSFRLCVMDPGISGNGSRLITEPNAGADPLDLHDSDSFRAEGLIEFTATDEFVIYLGVMEQFPDRSVDDYNWFGADKRYRKYSVDLGGVTDSASLNASISIDSQIDVVTDQSSRLIRVPGAAERFILATSQGEADETRQVARYQIVDGSDDIFK